MREILFRGKRIDNGEWIYGHYYHDQQFVIGFSYQEVHIVRNDCDEDYPVREKTVGQYTGLKDKYEVEAFEGDAAKYKDDNGTYQIGVITWCVFKYSIIAIGGDEEGNQDIELHPDYEFEVIGNIHENPELLEGSNG